MVGGARLRVAFFGTPSFAVPTLEALLRSRHELVGVVSQPDRPRGRGHQLRSSPVKEVAVAAGVPVLQPERLKEPGFREAFTALRADLGVVAAYGKILPEWLIAIPPLGMINVHASLLPRYRGAAPVHRAVMAGESETGVTIMRIVKELDAGAMFDKIVRPIPRDATSVDVERDLAASGAPLLVSVVDALADDRAVEQPQDETLATYAPKISRDEGRIDWTRSAWEIHNLVRGLAPWPHASTHVGSTRLLIIRTRAQPASPTGVPGEILEATRDALRVATADGVLHVVEVQPEGRRVMTSREFLAGHAITPGMRLT